MRRTAFVICLAVFVAGCGSDERSVTPSDNALARAAGATAAQKSAKATFDGTIEVGGQKGTIKGAGIVGFKPSASRIDMTVSIVGKDVDTESILRDGVMYTKLPAGADTHGKPWMKIDFDKLTGGGFSSAMSGSYDPSQYLQMLAASGSVKKVGSEDVGGQPTTHYSAEIDLEKSLEAQTKGNRKFLEQSLKYFDGDSLPVDVWIDGKDLIRRERIRIHTKEVNGAPAQKQDLTMDFSDYGAPTSSITAPPDEDTFDATESAANALNP